MKSSSIKIGITGFPGIGKTYFLNNLLKNSTNSTYIDCDKIGHDLLETDIVKKFIFTNFNVAFSKENNSIDKKKLADIIFSNKIEYNIYQDFISKLMYKEIEKNIDMVSNKYKYIFIDAALIFEWNIQNNLDEIIFINGNNKTRYELLKKRNIDIENFKKREFFLLNKKFKNLHSTIIIFNKRNIKNNLISKTKQHIEKKYECKL